MGSKPPRVYRRPSGKHSILHCFTSLTWIKYGFLNTEMARSVALPKGLMVDFVLLLLVQDPLMQQQPKIAMLLVMDPVFLKIMRHRMKLDRQRANKERRRKCFMLRNEVPVGKNEWKIWCDLHHTIACLCVLLINTISKQSLTLCVHLIQYLYCGYSF